MAMQQDGAEVRRLAVEVHHGPPPWLRPLIWALALSGLFAFRLFFGLASDLFSEDYTQVFLLGLGYYATGAWPYFGPDVTWTSSEIPGALQSLLVGVPFHIAPVPEAPYVALNLLSMGCLCLFAWYLCERLRDLPRWLIWGWLLTVPWTLEYSTNIINTSYILPGRPRVLPRLLRSLAINDTPARLANRCALPHGPGAWLDHSDPHDRAHTSPVCGRSVFLAAS